MTVFFRLNQEADKAEVLRGLCKSVDCSLSKQVFHRDPKSFAAIPGAPFAYWATEAALGVYQTHKSFEKHENFAGQGVATADNFRFIRLHWEIPSNPQSEPSWFGLAKGGAATKYYGDVYLKILWKSDGAEFKAWAGSLYGNSHWSRITMNYHRYGAYGLTWSRRSMAFAVRVLPGGCVFGDKGPAIFTKSQTPESLLSAAALLNSAPYNYLLGLQLSRVDLAKSYETGIVSRTPFPTLSDDVEQECALIAHELWRNLRTIDSKNEISHAFLLPPTLLQKAMRIDLEQIKDSCVALQARIDRIAYELYGLEEIPSENVVSSEESEAQGAGSSSKTGEDDTEQDDEKEVDVGADQSLGLLSWAVGVCFGRFDIRLATGERSFPAAPSPFEPLPGKSPGMVPDGEPTFLVAPGMLVDDSGHPDDLAGSIVAVYAKIGEIAPDVDSVTRTLRREFFQSHITMYSKSRRKAPIYWQLSTASASYSVWLYFHALNKDTLYRVQNDHIAPKVAHERRQLDALRADTERGLISGSQSNLAGQVEFVEELQAFSDEIARVAPLWNPNLNDGVIINFAPLWRLVMNHKAWQRELKATWDALCDGAYDWSHLAMHLWPERVVPKCADDRGLAIAHGLEEIFWFETEKGNWEAYEKSKISIDVLIRERTSVAAKAALKSLVEAPDAGAGPKRTRKTKAI